MLGTQKGFTMIGRGNAEMLRSIAQDYDNREQALIALAHAFDAQWNCLCGLEPHSVVERRLYNAICAAIGLPPRCEIEEDQPVRLGDEIAEQERSMEAVNAGAERLLGNTPTAIEEYAAWLARQPKPRTLEEATRHTLPGRSDHNAMLAIQELLDGVEWTHETLEQLAEIMAYAGYRIADNNITGMIEG